MSNKNESKNMNDMFELSLGSHIIVTSLFIFTAMSVSIFATDIGIVNSLLGSTAIPICCFIFPAMCVWKTNQATFQMKIINAFIAAFVSLISLLQLYRQLLIWTQ